jgi:hypothetical protein
MGNNIKNIDLKDDSSNDFYTLLPAVYTVSSWSGGKLIHLGTNEKLPLCGSNLQGAKLTDIKIRINKYGEIWEFWDSEVQTPKWVKCATYNYCKRCLSALNGR